MVLTAGPELSQCRLYVCDFLVTLARITFRQVKKPALPAGSPSPHLGRPVPGVTQTGRGVLGCPTAGRAFLAGLVGWVRGLAGRGYHQCKGAHGCAWSRRPGDRSIAGFREVLTP